MKQVALFSLNDISHADQFAEQLIKSGWDIIGSSETVEFMKIKGLPVQDIADFTGVQEEYGFPPTLHAKVEHALTMSGPPCIDLVYVIPYSLSIGNDVGGHTLLALAVKGGRTAVMSIQDMKRVVNAISETGEVPHYLRLELADKALFEIGMHYSSLVKNKDKYDFLLGRFSYNLLNGENPYQIPASAFISAAEDDSLSIHKFKHVSGDAPCFTNIADADSILNTMCLVHEAFMLNTGSAPYLCIAAKHGNACGLGVSRISPAHAVEKALFGNPRSIWGGEVITNFPVDENIAKMLLKNERREHLLGNSHWMLDLVMSPSFDIKAISILGNRKARKLFENAVLNSPSLKKSGFVYRTVRGGFLRQPPPTYILNLKECKVEEHTLSEVEIDSLITAWAVVFSSNLGGNEVAIVKDGALLGSGGGPSTIEAAGVAIARARECGHDPKGAVFAADAFFPFTDAPEILCDAGVTAGCIPGGGKNKERVSNYFKSIGVKMVFIPDEYRGFCRH